MPDWDIGKDLPMRPKPTIMLFAVAPRPMRLIASLGLTVCLAPSLIKNRVSGAVLPESLVVLLAIAPCLKGFVAALVATGSLGV